MIFTFPFDWDCDSVVFVLLGVFLHKFNSVILLNRWTRMLAIIVMTFLFDMGAIYLQ